MKLLQNGSVIGLLMVLMTFSAVAQSQTSVSTNLKEPGFEQYLDGLVNYAMKIHHLPGVVVSVVHNDSLVLAKGWGKARLDTGEPADPGKTLFRIASITKTFTFTGAMQLVESDRLDLDENISTYLKDVQIEGNERYGPLTFRHLMTHTAGFEDTYVGHFYADSPENDYDLTYYLNHYQPGRVRPPGQVISYSNYGVSLAGKVIEDISNEKFADYMEQHLLAPLKMSRTTFLSGPNMPSQLAESQAESYNWSNGKYCPLDSLYWHQGKFPAGSISTTAVDMARYMRAHLNAGSIDGIRILQPKMVQTMHEVIFSNAEGIRGNAHGFWSGSVAGYKTIEHGGAALGFHSNLVMVPELDLGIFVSTNGSSGHSFVSSIPQILTRNILQSKSEILPPDSSLLQQAEVYSGTYLGTRRGYTTIDKINLLLNGMIKVSVTEPGYLVIKGLGEARRYVPLRDHRFAEVGSGNTISFAVNDGQASRFFTRNQAFDRIEFWQTAQAFFLVVSISLVVFIGTLIGFWKRRNRTIEQTPGEKWASYSIGMTALLWLVSVCMLIYSLAVQRGPEPYILVHFPDLWVGVALWGTLISAIFTCLSVIGLIPVWKHRSWNIKRSISLTGVVLLMIALTLMLWQWNAIGIQVTGG